MRTKRSLAVSAVVLHVLRVLVFVLIIWLIRQEHRWYAAQQTGGRGGDVTADQIRDLFADVAHLTDWDPSRGGRNVVDQAGNPLGYFVTTSPASDSVVGFSGPTNTLVAFDTEDRVRGIKILRSGDTQEHVADVVRNEQFMTALNGKSWEDVPAAPVDAVSGATLTSLAIVEGIHLRLGGSKPSYRFPRPLAMADVKRLFPSAKRFAAADSGKTLVYAEDGIPAGSILRTSPAADDVMGYQGPTDTLMGLSPQTRILGIAVRDSYDNPQYVDYVKEDEYFHSLFHDKSLRQLAEIDLHESEVEGVSGATMTSMAVAEGLIRRARQQIAERSRPTRRIVFASRDVGTVLVLFFALLCAFTRLRASRRFRMTFYAVLVIYLGLLNGDMLAQALLVGWAQSGVPWRLAPGLVLLTAAALIVPVVSKRHFYCHYVCPFGAAQQLVRRRLPWQLRLPKWLIRSLELIPAALLLLVLLTAMLHLPINLAAIEPFDAFIFKIAGWSTLSVAILGLLGSALVPMAYCRYGCPTGAMLGFLRWGGMSGRFARRDWIALCLLAIAVILRVW